MTGPLWNHREPELHDLLLRFRGVRRTGRYRFRSTVSPSRKPKPRTLCCNGALGTDL